MKNIPEDEIAYLVENYKPSKMYIVNDNPKYNRKIVIDIKGRCDVDSRPRIVGKRLVNLKKLQVNKYFKKMVEKDKILKSVFITTPVLLEITGFIPIPKGNVTKEERRLMEKGLIEPMNTSDADNLPKLWMDCLEESDIYINDKSVCKLHSNKVFAKPHMVGVKIELYYNTDYIYDYHRDLISRSVKFNKYVLETYWEKKLVNQYTIEDYLKLFRTHYKKSSVTENDIKKLVRRITPDHRVILANAIKFKGKDLAKDFIKHLEKGE